MCGSGRGPPPTRLPVRDFYYEDNDSYLNTSDLCREIPSLQRCFCRDDAPQVRVLGVSRHLPTPPRPHLCVIPMDLGRFKERQGLSSSPLIRIPSLSNSTRRRRCEHPVGSPLLPVCRPVVPTTCFIPTVLRKSAGNGNAAAKHRRQHGNGDILGAPCWRLPLLIQKERETKSLRIAYARNSGVDAVLHAERRVFAICGFFPLSYLMRNVTLPENKITSGKRLASAADYSRLRWSF